MLYYNKNIYKILLKYIGIIGSVINSNYSGEGLIGDKDISL